MLMVMVMVIVLVMLMGMAMVGITMSDTPIRFHLWTRKHRPVFREHAGPDQQRREEASRSRVQNMLSGQDDSAALAGYGLGSKRSLAEYQTYCGVDFGARTLSQCAAERSTKCHCRSTDKALADEQNNVYILRNICIR